MNEQVSIPTTPPTDQATYAAGTASSAARLWAWLRQHATSDAAKTAFGAWLALRFFCSLIGSMLYLLVSATTVSTIVQRVFDGAIPVCPAYLLPNTGLSGLLTGMWFRWDTPWYVDIAAHGYSCYGSSAFMPLYPILMRGLGTVLGGNYLAAALLLSSIASFIAFYLLYQLAQDLTGSPAVARASVIALAVFPAAFFLMAGYTEALFLALALGSYLAARRGAWLSAGILVALATLTRLQGIVLLVLLGLDLLLAQRAALRRWQTWLALLLAPLVVVGYVVFLRLTQGLALPWEPLSSARGPWHLHFGWPWEGIFTDIRTMFADPSLGSILSSRLLDPLSALLFAICTVLAFRRLNLPLAAFLVLMWFSSVTKVTDTGYTTSISRYMLALFPAFIVLGILATGWPRPVRIGVTSISAILLSCYLFLFLIWGWVA